MNKEKRKNLIENGTFKDYSKKRRDAFLSGKLEQCYKTDTTITDNGEIIENIVLSDEYFEIEQDNLIECEKIRKCKNAQRNKIEKHIEYLFNKNYIDIYFATFTFNDNALKLSSDTRKQAVRRILTNSYDYILNIDYGTENEREHYHAIICFEKDKYNSYFDEYGHIKIKELDKYNKGFYSVELVNRDTKDKKKLSRYMNKLTSHSIKVLQQYISTKKGSDYQKYKSELNKKNEILKNKSEFTKINYQYIDKLMRHENPKQHEFTKNLSKLSKIKKENINIFN